MKSDRVVNDADDSQQNRSSADVEARFGQGVPDVAEPGVSSHDLRASLAIVNGFSAALVASFDDLCEQYRDILASCDDTRLAESADRLMALDADCRFCLSRLHTSIDQLKHRLHVEHEIGGQDPEERSD